jgi:hypothetical protein|tara:strand:+ start:329 stop:496 length:168 start_codon:yes stop_codon:yes gene_type:complete
MLRRYVQLLLSDTSEATQMDIPPITYKEKNNGVFTCDDSHIPVRIYMGIHSVFSE